jgi:predicted DNA-binding transcriptional regulator AlpA
MNGSVVPGSDEWLDAEQVAEILVISRRTLWNYASLGRLPADGSFGRSPAWKRSTIDRYLEGMPERGRSARANRAARLAARVHAEVPDGSSALCGVCGEPIVFRVVLHQDEATDAPATATEASTGPETGSTKPPPEPKLRGRWEGMDGRPHGH